LIDVNPRFYGSLPLALASGVNLPAIWHAAVGDGAGPAPGDYRVGVHYRWLRADVAAARDGAPRSLMRVAPRPRVGAVWAADDPLPSVVSTAGTVGKAARRRLGDRLRRPG
jgi:predicted ATP-grasp superfamily ATP-dependent carboligase